jgi:hypothetical protein
MPSDGLLTITNRYGESALPSAFIRPPRERSDVEALLGELASEPVQHSLASLTVGLTQQVYEPCERTL